MRVWVTRPARQAAHLAALIEARGGLALIQPVLEIVPPGDRNAARAMLADLQSFRIAIFTSRNAVDGFERLAGELRKALDGCSVLAVGAGTAAALRAHGVAAAHPPTEYSSQGLLALPALAPDKVAEQRVLIVKGEGGRGLLQRQLAERGALVDSVDVYRRVPLALPAAYRTGNACHALIATSVGALLAIAPTETGPAGDDLRNIAVVANSERVAEAARGRGFATVLAADEASDEGLVRALERLLQIIEVP